MKTALLFQLLFTIYIFPTQLLAQSENILKGEDGFEAVYSHSFIRGKDGHGIGIGCSVDGYLDFQAAYVSVAGQSSFGIGGAFHVGGELNKVGLAANGGYIFLKDSPYFVYGTTLYAHLDAKGAAMIPELSFQFASLDNVGFTGIFGISISGKGPVAFVINPQFVYNQSDPFLNLEVGFLLRS